MAASDAAALAWTPTFGPPSHSSLPARPGVQYVTCGGKGGDHRLAYVIYQPAGSVPDSHRAATPVVCAHGLTRNSFDYHWLATRLSSASGGGHSVLCFDAAGRAASEPLQNASAYGYEQYAADLHTLLDHVGWHTVHWVGTSMGGILGMLVASSRAATGSAGHQIASLTLVDIGPAVGAAPLRAIKEYVGTPLPGGQLAGVAAGRSYVTRTFPGMLPVPTSERLTQCAAYLTRPCPASLGSAAPFGPTPADSDDSAPRAPAYDPRISESFTAAVADKGMDMWPVWDAVACDSLLVLHGLESAVLTLETLKAMQTRVPAGVKSGNVSATSYAGVGHAPSLWSAEQEDAVVAAIQGKDPAAVGTA